MPDDVTSADDLYGLDPSEFTAARGALAKRLKADGKGEEAAAVAKLRRPSRMAWALDQVARHDPQRIGDALDAGARLREATDAAVAGDAAALRQAAADDRAASDAAVDAAVAVLGDRGPAGRTQLAATLRAAVLDEAVADQLRRGVLAEDHEAPGFGFGALAAPGAPAPESEAARERRRRQAELTAEAKRLRQLADRLGEEAERAEVRATEVRGEADAAAVAAAQAETTRDTER